MPEEDPRIRKKLKEKRNRYNLMNSLMDHLPLMNSLYDYLLLVKRGII